MTGKKLAMLGGIALVAFFIITQPSNSAGVVTTLVVFLRDAANSVVTFVTGIFHKG